VPSAPGRIYGRKWKASAKYAYWRCKWAIGYDLEPDSAKVKELAQGKGWLRLASGGRRGQQPLWITQQLQ
jgi:hypothetical protein